MPGSVCQPLQMQAAMEVAVVAGVRSGVSGGILFEQEADSKRANVPASEPISSPISVLALEEITSRSGLTFADGVGLLSCSCDRFEASVWPTSRCSSTTEIDVSKLSNYSALDLGGFAANSLNLDRKSFSWPLFGPRWDLLSTTTQVLPDSAQIPHFGLTRSQRALRRRHSSQASPGCCRVSPVVVAVVVLTMMTRSLC